MDRALGAELVGIRNVGTDRSPFRIEHDPSHPAADANGNVKLPNVNMLNRDGRSARGQPLL